MRLMFEGIRIDILVEYNIAHSYAEFCGEHNFLLFGSSGMGEGFFGDVFQRG